MKTITPVRPKWKGTMTDRERFNRQVHYQPVDRCFNMEFGFWDENFVQWPLFVENGITNNDEAEVFFSFDKFGHLGVLDQIEMPGVGCVDLHPVFPRQQIGETATTYIVMNRDGLTAEVPKDGHSTIPHFSNRESCLQPG